MEGVNVGQGSRMDVADRVVEVEQAYGYLDRQVSSLYETVSELERRLAPVLRQSVEAMKREMEPTPGYSSPLAARVQNSAEALSRTLSRLSDMIDRIEV